jgi:preprotein translocase subunit SecB
MNDIITPFILVFLNEYFPDLDFETLKLPANFEETLTPEIELNVPELKIITQIRSKPIRTTAFLG